MPPREFVPPEVAPSTMWRSQMAIVNSTGNRSFSVFQGFCPLPLQLVEHEKKSSSDALFSDRDLLDLLGRRVRVAHLVEVISGECPYFLSSRIYEAKVLAVQLGSFSDFIETSLLLLEDGYDQPDCINVSNLTLLRVFDIP